MKTITLTLTAILMASASAASFAEGFPVEIYGNFATNTQVGNVSSTVNGNNATGNINIAGIQGNARITGSYNTTVQAGNVSTNVQGNGASANINIGGVQSRP